VTIISTGPPVLGLVREAAFNLRLEARGSVSEAVLAWSDGKGEKQREVLAESVSGLSFGYLPSSAKGAGIAMWRSRWGTNDGALSALRIVIRFHSAERAREIVLAVETEIPVACLRDARQSGCTLEAVGQ
jgi:hypothetical protein